MDTCLVTGDKNLSWSDAWTTCFNAGSRLLEIPNATYSSIYTGLVSPLFVNPLDERWMGFKRNSSSTPAMRWWYHGLHSEDMAWAYSVTTVPGSYPLCGRINKMSSRSIWAEESCSLGSNKTYFCQFLLAEGKITN